MIDPKKPTKRPPGLDAPVQAHLGETLRTFYDAMLTEPVPDRLTALLDELERREREAGEAPTGKGEPA